MSNVPPGVTRYSRVGSVGLRRPNRVGDPLVVVVVAAAGVVLALTGAVRPGTVLLALVAGLVVPALSFVLPLVLRVLVVVAVLVAALAYDSSVQRLGLYAVIFWIVCVGAGVLLLMGLLHWWQFRRRMATAQGAPPSGRDPSRGADVGRLAVWDDGEYDDEMVDPDVDTVLAAVRALDGKQRTYVSIYDGRSRFDVGGDAGSYLVVQQTDNRLVWHMLCDPTLPDPTEDKQARLDNRVAVGYGREQMTINRYRLTRLAWAEQATRVWTTSGQRDQTLPWWTSSANWPAPRPELFKASDG